MMANSSITESYLMSTEASVISTIGNISSTSYPSQTQNTLVQFWNFILREIAAEKAWIRSRGVCMWLFNDHLLAILAAVILIFFISSVLFGRKITKRQKRKMLEANAVKSEDYLLYRPFEGNPLTRDTAFPPDLPKSIPIIANSRSSLCLLPATDENTTLSPGSIKICHQNVPRYLLPMYRHSLTEIQIPYTPAVDRLQFNQPGSPSKYVKRPKPSASSPAIMNGLWVRLENVLKTRKEERKEDSTLQARQSKSDDEALQCCHQRLAGDVPRLRGICSDCQAKKLHKNKMGVAICGSDESFGFEDIDLNDDDWPSYMYPSRQRFANETVPGNFNQAHRGVPRLSTFPTSRTHRPVRVIEQLQPFGLSKHLTETDSSSPTSSPQRRIRRLEGVLEDMKQTYLKSHLMGSF